MTEETQAFKSTSYWEKEVRKQSVLLIRVTVKSPWCEELDKKLLYREFKCHRNHICWPWIMKEGWFSVAIQAVEGSQHPDKLKKENWQIDKITTQVFLISFSILQENAAYMTNWKRNQTSLSVISRSLIYLNTVRLQKVSPFIILSSGKVVENLS